MVTRVLLLLIDVFCKCCCVDVVAILKQWLVDVWGYLHIVDVALPRKWLLGIAARKS